MGDRKGQPVKVLTIGGSDCSGAFGVQADLKTFSTYSVHGMSVITIVTAQNSVGWYGGEFMSADFVAAQLDAVLGDYGVDAVKTGFLAKPEIVIRVAERLATCDLASLRLVVDPVLVNAAGRSMFAQETTAAYIEMLLPLATVMTPNWEEAEVLAGLLPGATLEDDPADAAVRLVDQIQKRVSAYGRCPAIYLKGRANQEHIVDYCFEGERMTTRSAPRVDTLNVSGSGDSLSAAIACQLSQDKSLEEAVDLAHKFVMRAIINGAEWQLGKGPGPVDNISLYEH